MVDRTPTIKSVQGYNKQEVSNLMLSKVLAKR